MVYPMATHPRRSASSTEPVSAEQGATLESESLLFSLRISGICPA